MSQGARPWRDREYADVERATLASRLAKCKDENEDLKSLLGQARDFIILRYDGRMHGPEVVGITHTIDRAISDTMYDEPSSVMQTLNRYNEHLTRKMRNAIRALRSGHGSREWIANQLESALDKQQAAAEEDDALD